MKLTTNQTYQSPFTTKYSTPEMLYLFSQEHKIRTYRKLWIALAESQNLPKKTIKQMKLGLNPQKINYKQITKYEKQTKHEIVANIKAYEDITPLAKGKIHNGATSQYIVDNTDTLIMRSALQEILTQLYKISNQLANLAREHKDLPALAYTHYQPAQPTTLGKRFATYLYDTRIDIDQIEYQLSQLKMLGHKGATGTQATILTQLEGKLTWQQSMYVDSLNRAAQDLDKQICNKFKMDPHPITTQTYTRKIDAIIINTLATIAASVHKFCNDIRLLSNTKQLQEKFTTTQVGSSAMPYKQNPILSERATGIARYIISLANNTLNTAAEQWLERTLDDSSNKKIVIPEAFLATNATLNLQSQILNSLKINKHAITQQLNNELPYLITEEILTQAVKKGIDRQTAHETIKQHALQATKNMENGSPNNLIQLVADDPLFQTIDIKKIITKNLTGNSAHQVEQYLNKLEND